MNYECLMGMPWFLASMSAVTLPPGTSLVGFLEAMLKE